jgi:hypothetical protein
VKEFKKNIFLLTIVVCMFGCDKKEIFISEQPASISFVKTFGGSKNESARSVLKTQDGGYAVFGYTQSNDGDVVSTKTTIQYDFWLLKFDANDNLEWQKTYGGSNDEKGYKIIQTQDGGFAVIGYSKSSDGDLVINEGFEDVWILKLNALGVIEWKTNTGFSGSDKGFSIIQTLEGGYFLGAILDVTASGGLGNSKTLNRHAGGDFWGIKISNTGSIEWRKYFGGTNTEICYDAVEVVDGYLLIGSSDSLDVDIKNNKGSYDFWVVKIDKNGLLVWEKSFGGKEIDESYQIIKTADNNFLIVGETRSSDQDVSSQNGGADVWVLKIDSNGEMLWEKTYGGANFDAAKAITLTNDGNFLIAGNTRSVDNDVTNNNGENDVWVLKINPSGNLIWQKTIGGSGIDLANDIVELNDNSILVVGESNSNDKDVKENKGFTDLLIVKLK